MIFSQIKLIVNRLIIFRAKAFRSISGAPDKKTRCSLIQAPCAGQRALQIQPCTTQRYGQTSQLSIAQRLAGCTTIGGLNDSVAS